MTETAVDPKALIIEHMGWFVHVSKKMTVLRPHYSEDVMQEGIIEALRCVERYDGRIPLWNWMKTSAKLRMQYEAYGRGRQGNTPEGIEYPDGLPSISTASDSRADGSFSADKSPWWGQLSVDLGLSDIAFHSDEIYAALHEECSKDEWNYLYFRFWEGRSAREIVEMLDLDTNPVDLYHHMWRNRGCIRERLQKRLSHLKELVS